MPSNNIIITNDKTALELHRALRALNRVVNDFETDIRSGNQLIKLDILTPDMKKNFDDLSEKLDIAYQQIDFLTAFLEKENAFEGRFEISFKKRLLSKKVLLQSTWYDVFNKKLQEIKKQNDLNKRKNKEFIINILWINESGIDYIKKIEGLWQ